MAKDSSLYLAADTNIENGKKDFPNQNGNCGSTDSIPNLKNKQAIDKPVLSKKYTRRQWLALISLAFGNFCAAASFSLQSPFYPSEAEKKGATPTEYGLVFGVFQLTIFIVAPVFGKVVGFIGPNFMLNAGLFLLGSSCILFGILDKSPHGLPFVALSIAVRIVEGLGSAAFITSSYTIVATEFPDSVATTFGSLQTVFGIGLIAGPTMGGALYDAGGYPLPFLFIGTLIIFCAVVTKFLLPSSDISKDIKSGNLRKFWSDISVIMDCSVVFMSYFCIGFNAATLEPHIRRFELSAFLVGMVFIVPGGVFGITSPFWGRLCDKGVHPKIVSIIGLIFEAVCYTFLAPVPFLFYEPKLWTVILSLVFFGLGVAAALISAFIGTLKNTIQNGFPDDVSTYGMVSSVFSVGNSLGAFLGPIIGGALLENLGYNEGSLVVVALILVLITGLIIFTCWQRIVKRNSSDTSKCEGSEKQPILNGHHPSALYNNSNNDNL